MSQPSEIMTFASSIMTTFHPTRETRPKGGGASTPDRGSSSSRHRPKMGRNNRNGDGDDDAIYVTTTSGFTTIEQLLDNCTHFPL